MRDLAHAYDTLLIGNDPGLIQKVMRSEEACGAHYDLQLKWKKVELSGVRSISSFFCFPPGDELA